MQGSKLFVGNLNYGITEDQLRDLFSDHGEVTEIKIIEGRGFAFIEMETQVAAEKVRANLNNTDYQGRSLRIDIARPPERRGRGGRDSDSRRRY